jgi:hypothetical protein
LCSIGTLFAFVLVCAGVLVLQNKPNIPRGKFKTPYVNAKYIAPVLLIMGLVVAFTYNKDNTMAFLTNEKQANLPADIVTNISPAEAKIAYEFLVFKNESDAKTPDLEALLSKYADDETQYNNLIAELPLNEDVKYQAGFELFKHKIPMWIFMIVLICLVVWTYKQNLSLIPLLGLVSCLYMMAELSVWNWLYFTIWLLIGLVIYFGYSRKNSKLNTIINS